MHTLFFETNLYNDTKHNIREWNFYELKTTLIDADTVFLSIEHLASKMNVNQGLNLIEKPGMNALKRIFEHRAKEFKEFFYELGRTLIITRPSEGKFDYEVIDDPYQKEVFNIWDCIGIPAPNFSRMEGSNINTTKEDIAKEFLDTFGSSLFYSQVISGSQGVPLFLIKGTQYVVGEYHRIGKGLILILPAFKGLPPERVLSFVNSLSRVATGLKNQPTENTLEYPPMVDEYSTETELVELAKLSELKNKLENLINSIDAQRSILEGHKRAKILFTADGDLLENACQSVFSDFGFQVSKPDKKRDDLVVEMDGKVAVVEIKGVGKSAAEKHSAQLQKWVSDYHVSNDVNPKGILIVNTFKNLPIEQRTERDVPDQMMKYVTQMGQCVVTGLQLFAMHVDFKNKKISKTEIADLLFNSVGELKYTENIHDYIKKLNPI